MRLAKIERGHPWTRPLYAIIRLATGRRAPDVIRVMKYRPRFFGEPASTLTQAVMRGESSWSVGERELFAAFVSRLNQCEF